MILLEEHSLDIDYIETKEQLTDSLTKGLLRN